MYVGAFQKDEVLTWNLKALLDQFSVIFKNVRPRVDRGQVHPVVQLLQELWPVFAILLNRYKNYRPVIENCSKIIRNAVISYGFSMASLLPSIMSTLCNHMEYHSKSNAEFAAALIWTTEAIAKEFLEDYEPGVTTTGSGAKVEDIAVVWQFVENIANQTFGIIQRAQASNSLEHIPEGTFKALRELVQRVLKAFFMFLQWLRTFSTSPHPLLMSRRQHSSGRQSSRPSLTAACAASTSSTPKLLRKYLSFLPYPLNLQPPAPR